LIERQSPQLSIVDSDDVANRRLAAVAFIDIVGYTVLMSEEEEPTHAHWMRVLNESVRPATTRHRGRIVKSTGDGVLAEFPSAHDALGWALEVQTDLEKSPKLTASAERIAARIAVHLGDVYSTDDDIYGSGVNVAARLQEHAEPGGIVLSEAVYDLVRSALDVPTRDLGLLELKNISAPVKAYAIESHHGVERTRKLRDALPSIAVLPLRNLSKDPDNDYFAQGIVEDIVVSLSSLREMTVISRTASLAVAREQADPREAGRALGVRYVMGGSVRRSSEKVRVSIQLYDVRTGANVWGDSSEVLPDELFEAQDRIVRKIAAGIAPHVRAVELSNAMRKRPENFTAYDCTLKALNRMDSLERETFLEARRYFEQAMSEDPNFAMPVAWAARWHSVLIGQGWSEDRDRDSKAAVDLAARAIKLDPRNAVALATYGHLRAYLFHDYETALVYFERALTACPNSALAMVLKSGTLSYLGRGEEAVVYATHAVELSPFDHNLYYFYVFLSMAYYIKGDYESAVKWGRMSHSENPAYTANLRILAAALAACDLDEEAHEVAARLMQLEPDFSLDNYKRTLLPFSDAEICSRYIEHLSRAGLPP
jgi:adenylate cyclase